nr:extensin-like isoform X2 [Oncorhynchus nerka]
MEEHQVLLLKDKGKRKPKGMEKETEKKRHRFTPGDEDLIISGVLGHWEDLFGAQAHIRPRGSKTATWNTIAGTLTSAVARCGDDVRKKYNLIRSQIKQKVSSIRTLSTQTGGGPNTVPALTDLEQQLFSRMAETEAGVGPVDLGFGLSQGEISSSGPPPAAEGTVESALPSVTMEELPSTSPSTPWPAPTVPPQPIISRPAPAHSGSAPQPMTSRPAPAHSIHSQSMNQIYFTKPFLHQQLSQSALQIPSLKPQIASNADALSGFAPQPITSCPAPAHSIHSGTAPQPITSRPAPAHSIHSGFAPQPITSVLHQLIPSTLAPHPNPSPPVLHQLIPSTLAPHPNPSTPVLHQLIPSTLALLPNPSPPVLHQLIPSTLAPHPNPSPPVLHQLIPSTLTLHPNPSRLAGHHKAPKPICSNKSWTHKRNKSMLHRPPSTSTKLFMIY